MGKRETKVRLSKRKAITKKKTLQVLVFVTAILNLIQALVKLIAEAIK